MDADISQLLAIGFAHWKEEKRMNRNDWVFVGVRLLGLYFFVTGVRGLPTVFMFMGDDLYSDGVLLSSVVQWALGIIIGMLLFFGAPSIMRWLERKDARLEPRSGKPQFDEE